MAEQNEQLDSTPENNPKRLEYWTDQEIEKFVNAFSVGDFELVKPKEGEQEGYVRVRIPSVVEPMAKGLIKAEWQMVEALDAPLEKESQERISHFIGDTANVTGASEAQEAEWIQAFGRFFQVVGEREGQPDHTLEETKTRFREETRKALATHLKILLVVANDFSWDSFIQEQIDKYGNEEPPQDVLNTLSAKHEDYQEIKKLIDRNPQAGQTPRFVLISSQGRELFRSTPDLSVS